MTSSVNEIVVTEDKLNETDRRWSVERQTQSTSGPRRGNANVNAACFFALVKNGPPVCRVKNSLAPTVKTYA